MKGVKCHIKSLMSNPRTLALHPDPVTPLDLPATLQQLVLNLQTNTPQK